MTVDLPQYIGYGRLDNLLQVFAALKGPPANSALELNWQKTQGIAPAGHAILACLFDSSIEHGYKLKSKFIKNDLASIPSVKNVSEITKYSALPKPNFHTQSLDKALIWGQENTLNLAFAEALEEKFKKYLSEDLSFSCRLILNELMQNSLDHSGSERYYLYAGTWIGSKAREFHIGVLDMGVSIPAKLQQKYECKNDSEYLDLALREGITTRRIRPGGLGMFHTFEHLKDLNGTLTIVSRNAHLIRYFKHKRIRRNVNKFTLNGTWCMARLPLEQ